MAKKFGTPRRTVLLEGGGAALPAAVPLEVADDPCVVLMSATGLVARVPVTGPAPDDYPERALVPPPGDASRAAHDVVISAVRATVRGTIGLVTSAGRLVKLNVLELPANATRRGRRVAGRRHAGHRVHHSIAGGDCGRALRCRRSWRWCRPWYRRGRGQAGTARLPAEPGRVRADHAEIRGPGRRGGAAIRRVGGAGVRHVGRPAAALCRLGCPPAGPGGRRHGRRAAVGGRLGGVVRRGRRGRGGRDAVRAAGNLLPRRGGHRGGQHLRAARDGGRQRRR